MTFPFHPLANIFPLIEGAEFDELVASIKANGLRDLIVIHDGMVLDGRNRQRACEAAQVDARYEPLPADTEPLAFVIDKNLKRRHLNESQRAMVAARLANMPPHRPEDKSANLQTSQSDAAALVNVSTRSVASAVKVQAKAAPEVQRAVERGILPVSTAADLAELSADEQRRVVEADKPDIARHARNEIKKHKRNDREAMLGAKQQALPDSKFGVIVDDYEWDYQTWGDGGMDRHAANHYPTSTDAHTAAEIVERTKARFAVAADDCVHFMWAPIPHLAIAIDVMRLRGFAYKSHYAWGKDKIGLGHWNREKHELLLIGVKGHIDCPAKGDQWDSLINATRGEHSAKPECFLEMIETYFPTLPKIEFNRRGPARPGWSAWGNEVDESEAA